MHSSFSVVVSDESLDDESFEESSLSSLDESLPLLELDDSSSDELSVSVPERSRGAYKKYPDTI